MSRPELVDPTLPPPLFDIDTDSDETDLALAADQAWAAIFTETGHGVALTEYGRHHGLGPGAFPAPYCGLALYGFVPSGAGQRKWIYHVCSTLGQHDRHRCDRCDETW